MICDFCGKEMLQYQPVVMEQHGEFVDGKFQPVEEPRIHHDECESED